MDLDQEIDRLLEGNIIVLGGNSNGALLKGGLGGDVAADHGKHRQEEGKERSGSHGGD